MPLDRAETLEVLTQASNHAVVRMPGRRFPGSVVQGDTLHTLYADIRRLERQLGDVLGQKHELVEDAAWIASHLQERLWWYEQELRRAGYKELPYPISVGAPVELNEDE